MDIQKSLKDIISLCVADTYLMQSLNKIDASKFTSEEKTGMNMLPLMILASLIEVGLKDTAKKE